jgi:transcriptional regulator GlxA family with amidase domain
MTFALEHLDEALDADTLARQARMSRRSFGRRFRDAAGTSVTQWLLHQRVLRAQRLLENAHLSIDAVAREVGMSTAITLRRTSGA